MRKFWISYLIANSILSVLALIITAKNADAPFLPFLMGGFLIPLPAVIVGIWQPNPKWKLMLGFFAALVGILLIILLLPALSGGWK